MNNFKTLNSVRPVKVPLSPPLQCGALYYSDLCVCIHYLTKPACLSLSIVSLKNSSNNIDILLFYEFICSHTFIIKDQKYMKINIKK